MIDTSLRNQKILQIKKILLDISDMYDSNGLNISFSIPYGCKNPEKIRMRIEEVN